jgi:iron(III) transport system substrate-binding protein
MVLYASTPEDFLKVIIADFEAETGIKIEVVAAGTGELYKRIEAEGKNPLGDVMLGGMVSSGYMPNLKLWAEYVSPNDAAMPQAFRNTSGRITSFNLVPSVIMVNNKLARGIKIEGYEDLLNPALKGKIVIPSPSQTSSGWEQLVNILYAMGGGDTEKGWTFVDRLIANTKILQGSSATHKGVADGEYTVGLVAEGMVDIYTKEGVDVSKVFMKEGVIVNVDGIAIIEGCKNRKNAEKFIDFMTSKNFQAKMATLNPARRPIRSDVDGTSTLTPTSEIKQISFDMNYVGANKDKMLDRFKDIATKY